MHHRTLTCTVDHTKERGTCHQGLSGLKAGVLGRRPKASEMTNLAQVLRLPTLVHYLPTIMEKHDNIWLYKPILCTALLSFLIVPGRVIHLLYHAFVST